jgi:hypothetical protein
MNAPSTKRWVLLGTTSALAIAGCVWLAATQWRRVPDWMSTAAANPLAVKCLLIMVGAGVGLGLLAAFASRMRQGKVVRPGFHADQGGTAAIQMVLLMPVALLIFLLFIQTAVLFNANMVVHYAAFAAARMATVVVPMEMADELHNLMYSPDQGVSQKWEMIRRAGVLALVPVSAQLSESSGSMSGAMPLPRGGDAVADAASGAFSAAGEERRRWVGRTAAQYNYADAYTQVDIEMPEHWRDGNPDPDCPYRHHRRDEWTQWGWSYVPYCPFFHREMPIWDFAYWERLNVTLTHQFLLEVPYASRLLGEQADVPGLQGTQYQTEIVVEVSFTNEGGVEIPPRDAVN